jgi:hypothetical protein
MPLLAHCKNSACCRASAERSERGEPGEFDRMSDDELHKAVLDRAERLGLFPKNQTQH